VQPFLSTVSAIAVLLHGLLGCCVHHAHAADPNCIGSPCQAGDELRTEHRVDGSRGVHEADHEHSHSHHDSSDEPGSPGRGCQSEACFSILTAKCSFSAVVAIWLPLTPQFDAAIIYSGQVGDVLPDDRPETPLRVHLIHCVLLV
jgi:hypothetical protein